LLLLFVTQHDLGKVTHQVSENEADLVTPNLAVFGGKGHRNLAHIRLKVLVEAVSEMFREFFGLLTHQRLIKGAINIACLEVDLHLILFGTGELSY
jgi:hypothetical protein